MWYQGVLGTGGYPRVPSLEKEAISTHLRQWM